MKIFRLIIIFLIIISRIDVVNAQVLDTFNYVKNFELQKAQYIGKPFSILLNDMQQIQPKSVWQGIYIRNKNIIPYNSFYFELPQNTFRYGIVVNMIIYWQTALPATEVKYYQNKNHFHFTNEERQYYENKIIRDIIVIKKGD